LNLFKKGMRFTSSSVSPLFEMAIITSSDVTIPRSPWDASAGWRKKAGVPVDARVAAIFFPTNPDFPIPVTTTLPLELKINSTAFSKSLLSLSTRAETA